MIEAIRPPIETPTRIADPSDERVQDRERIADQLVETVALTRSGRSDLPLPRGS